MQVMALLLRLWMCFFVMCEMSKDKEGMMRSVTIRYSFFITCSLSETHSEM